MLKGAELAQRALDALAEAVVILSADRRDVLHVNAAADAILRDRKLPRNIKHAVEAYLDKRVQLARPPAVRVAEGEGGYYLHVVRHEGDPVVEIVILRREVVRDLDLFRLLEARFGVTRREYQVITGLRLGKTNRQLALEYGIAEGTVARHIHRLLERLEVPNRTGLVHMVESLVRR